MIQQAKILSNTQLCADTFRMELACENEMVKPGQFVQLQIPGYYLRRPISICEKSENGIVLIYKVVGDGTKKLSTMSDTIDFFGPLGTGFPIEKRDHVVLIGGGVGVPPLYETAKQYLKQGSKVDVVLGFNTKDQAFYLDEFRDLGCSVSVATMDGSLGIKGTVMDAISANNISVDFLESCGPLPMLKALQSAYTEGYLSLEARMACGMGACMGCVVKDGDGHSLRVCKDGPVFPLGKVVL